MLKTGLIGATVLLLFVPAADGQEYSVEKIDTAPQADEVSEEIASLIAAEGMRVKRDATRTVCELWLCKTLAVEADFEASDERLYPFSPGQLIGLFHLSRRGSEFRDQTVSSGWYTLRFGLQPVDGNHEGTSPTRDFLLLVDAEQDDLPDTWEAEEALHEASSEAAGSSHPAMLCLQRPGDGSEPAIRHDQTNDWWVVHLLANGVSNQKPQDIPIDLVVVGHAAE